jgi:regulation of enolase protein 1 (concanavalin A-like superfamily)
VICRLANILDELCNGLGAFANERERVLRVARVAESALRVEIVPDLSDTLGLRYVTPILCLFITAEVLCARVATVQTRQGDIFTGHARFTKDAIMVVNSSRNLVVAVPGTNVLSLTYEDDATPVEREESSFGVLPGSWREQQVGVAEVAGSTRVRGRNFTVRGAGTRLDSESDSLHYVYQPVRGDYEIVARVTTVQQTGPNARAGLMMRETLGEYGRAVGVTMTPYRGGAFHARTTEGRTPQAQAQPDLRPPCWVKLRRRGQEFYGYKSRNGRQWTLIQQAQVPMNTNYYVGLAVASGRSDRLNWTTFDGVRTGEKLRNEEFTPRVELTSGSVIRGRPLELDGNDIQFEGGRRVVAVPSSLVARIIYQPLSPDLAWKARASRPGVWMHGGDFFEGSLQELSAERVRISSVLYGLRSFDITDEVLALVLRNSRVSVATAEVETIDGAVLLGTAAAFSDGELHMRETALGTLRLSASSIRSLRLK